MMLDLERIRADVAAFAARETPALAGRVAVLAVSGGADSIATAAILCEARVVDPGHTVIAHFDHRLRGREAASRDFAAVEALSTRYALRLEVGAWEAPRAGEAHAREARYAFLAGVASRLAAPVVTGHTADDQAETVLMHAMRGAGLHGLRGMAPESARWGVTVVRPALCLTRAETRGYCDAVGLQFIDDETNDDTRLLRNRVRLGVLPHPAARAEVRARLLRISSDAAAAAAAVDGAAARAIIRAGTSAVVLSRDELRALGPAGAAHALRAAVIALLGDAADVGRAHYEAFARAVGGRTGTQLQLPRGLAVAVDAREVTVSRGPLPCDDIEAGFAEPLPFDGAAGRWRLSITPAPAGLADAVRFPSDAVVRRRRPGDRIRLPGGMRKLQDLFVDLKIPRRERDGIPLIAAGSDVLWTPYRAGLARTEAGARWHITCMSV